MSAQVDYYCPNDTLCACGEPLSSHTVDDKGHLYRTQRGQVVCPQFLAHDDIVRDRRLRRARRAADEEARQRAEDERRRRKGKKVARRRKKPADDAGDVPWQR